MILRIADWLLGKCGAIWRWQSRRPWYIYPFTIFLALYAICMVFALAICFYGLGWVGLLKKWTIRGVHYTRMRMRHAGLAGKAFWLLLFLFCGLWHCFAWALSIGSAVNDAATAVDIIDSAMS